VLIFEALQPARRYVVFDWRRGLVRWWFSRKPFSHFVVFPGRIQWVHQWHPQLWRLLQIEGRASRPSIILVRMPPLKFGEKRKLEEFLGMGGGYVLGFSDRTFREFVHDSAGLDIDDPEVGGMLL